MAFGDYKIDITVDDLADSFEIASAVGVNTNGFALNGFISDPTVTYHYPSSKCDHEMADETELVDGRVAGHCAHCGDRIYGRRMIGGLGLARLKAALVDALGDDDAMGDLADELKRVEMMLELEEEGLEDARKLIATAKRMITALLVREEVATLE